MKNVWHRLVPLEQQITHALVGRINVNAMQERVRSRAYREMNAVSDASGWVAGRVAGVGADELPNMFKVHPGGAVW